MKKELNVILDVLILFMAMTSLISLTSAATITLEEGNENCPLKVRAILPDEVVFQVNDVIKKIKLNDSGYIEGYNIDVKDVLYSGKASVVNKVWMLISPDLNDSCFREATEEELALGTGENYTQCPNTIKTEYTVKLKPETVDNYYCPDMQINTSKQITTDKLGKQTGINYIKANFSGFPDLLYTECLNNELMPDNYLLFEKTCDDNNTICKFYREAFICEDTEYYYIFEHKNNQDKLYGPFGNFTAEEDKTEKAETKTKTSGAGTEERDEEENFLMRFFKWIFNLFKKK